MTRIVHFMCIYLHCVTEMWYLASFQTRDKAGPTRLISFSFGDFFYGLLHAFITGTWATWAISFARSKLKYGPRTSYEFLPSYPPADRY